jgi:hypothetical protein
VPTNHKSYSSSLVRITPTCLDPQGDLQQMPPKLDVSLIPRAPKGSGEPYLLVITCSHHLRLSRPPGALRHRGPKLDVSLFPRGPTGPGEPYSSALLRITPTCLDAQAAYTGCFFVPQGPQGPRGALLVITRSSHLHLSRSPGAPSALGD